MYRNIQTFAVKMLQECNFWAFRNSAAQTFFSDTKQKHVWWKICKVFLKETIVKSVIILASFSWF